MQCLEGVFSIDRVGRLVQFISGSRQILDFDAIVRVCVCVEGRKPQPVDLHVMTLYLI
jgi:hypothetical protein